MAEQVEWVPYSRRSEWKDIVPLPQDDGPYFVVRIIYSEQFVDIMDYFRAVLKKGEISSRALELTKDVISVNSANYTVWAYRRILLSGLNADLRAELEFTEKFIKDSPKNYQVWFHRQWLVARLRDASGEAAFTKRILADDAKNYHAWTHRQWAVETFGLWDAELPLVDELIDEDVRNNSAWNQRFFVVSHTCSLGDRSVVQREIDYAKKCILVCPNNESPWSYLKGFFVKGPLRFSDFPELKVWVTHITAKFPLCTYAYSLLVDILQAEATADSLQQAIQHCGVLASSLDTIRRKYWLFRQHSILEPLLAALCPAPPPAPASVPESAPGNK